MPRCGHEYRLSRSCTAQIDRFTRRLKKRIPPPREHCALLFCLVFHESLDAGRRRGFVSQKLEFEFQP